MVSNLYTGISRVHSSNGYSDRSNKWNEDRINAESIIQGGYLVDYGRTWMWMAGRLLDTAMPSLSCPTRSELD